MPVKLRDFQSMLDHYQVMNHGDPNSAEISTADFYVVDTEWEARTDDERAMYLWAESYVFPASGNDWAGIYQQVYRANAVLHGMSQIDSDVNSAEWEDVLGQALFHRGRAFFHAVSIWSLAYDEGTASVDLGVPLRLTPNFNESSVRPTVRETYNRVIKDLKESIHLLPTTSQSVYRPSKAAAYGLLARVYLTMRDYDNALAFADSSLAIQQNLLDFNLLNVSDYSIPQFNEEIIFYSHMGASRFLRQPASRVDSALYTLYSEKDLRKKIFFQEISDGENIYPSFIGNYNVNTTQLFNGLTTAEIYLIRSECRLRAEDITGALNDLNQIRRQRIETGTNQEFVSDSSSEVLKEILEERRKELVFRGVRWMDMKRLNKEGHEIIQTRRIGNQTYSLPANSPRYALPIPEEIIQLTGMPQNSY